MPPGERDGERLRREHAAAGRLGPLLHLGATIGSGVAFIAAGLWLCRDVAPGELVFAAGVVVVANTIEHALHRRLMHRRTRAAAAVYHSHAEVHHAIYRKDDMAIRDLRELPLVLLKPWAVLAAVVGVAPGAALFLALGARNLAGLLVTTAAAYVLAYELLHLLYHLRLGVALHAGRHHAAHHERADGNFNVSFPLWDLVAGTRLKERA